jgi:transposase-like protein
MQFFSDHTSQLTLEEFVQKFNTEQACADYLYEQKWPDGYCCPRCEERQASKITTRRLHLYECLHCGHQASLTVGTVMENSSTDLRKWFTAFYLVSRQWGISAVELRDRIEVTYKTAWLMLMFIRKPLLLVC